MACYKVLLKEGSGRKVQKGWDSKQLLLLVE
jgi:hypothetical protein